MSSKDNTTVQQAVNFARSKGKNTYIFSETLTSKNVVPLLKELETIKGRVRIRFQKCDITSECTTILGNIIKHRGEMDTLMFDSVIIENPELLFETVGLATDMSHLSFSNCNLSRANHSFLCNSIKELQHLKLFDFSKDKCSPQCFNEICLSLCNHKELTCFQWSDNLLGDSHNFVLMFRTCPKLSHINMLNVPISSFWGNIFLQLLDETFRLENLEISDPGRELNEKCERNLNRAEQAMEGTSSRLSIYCKPDVEFW